MEKLVKVYHTVTEAVCDLIKRGYRIDFSICADQYMLLNKVLELSPDKFKIDEIHRFEGISDEGDGMIVFAISSLDSKIRGTVVNALGVYSSGTSFPLLDHLLLC